MSDPADKAQLPARRDRMAVATGSAAAPAARRVSSDQLFGSATWWLFFDDGYAAMDALDDDRDGALTGEELNSLSLWVDADSDGVSDPGEVKPLAAFNITRLSTRADEDVRVGTNNESLISARGVTFASGRVDPTFDWVTRPLAPLAPPALNPAATSEK